MEAVGAASAIIQIAGFGLETSVKLVTFAGQLKTAPERVNSLAEDVSLNSSILKQLGELMKESLDEDRKSGDKFIQMKKKPPQIRQSIFNADGLEVTMKVANRCEVLFKTLESSLMEASSQLRSNRSRLGAKIRLSRTERLKWPFLLPEIDRVQTDLRDAKGTLMLMLQVVSLAYSRRMAGSNGNNTGQNSNSTVYSKDDESFLIRSILVGHGNQNLLMAMGMGGKGQALDQIPDIPTRDEKPPQKGSTPDGSVGTTSTPSPLSFWKGRLANNKPNAPDGARDMGIKGGSVKPNASTPTINAMLANPKPNPTSSTDPQDTTRPQFHVITPEGVIRNNEIHITYRAKPIEGAPSILMNPDLWKNENKGTITDQWAALSPEEQVAITQIGLGDGDGDVIGLEHLEWLHVGESQKVALEVPSARSLTVLVKKAAAPPRRSLSSGRQNKPPAEKKFRFIRDYGLDSAPYEKVVDEPVLPVRSSHRPVPEWLERTSMSSGGRINLQKSSISPGAKPLARQAGERRASDASRRESNLELLSSFEYTDTHTDMSSIVHYSNAETRMVNESGSPYDALKPRFTQPPHEASGPSQTRRSEPPCISHSMPPSELSVGEDKLGWGDSSTPSAMRCGGEDDSEREEESESESEPGDEGGDTERAEQLVQNLLNRFTTL